MGKSIMFYNPRTKQIKKSPIGFSLSQSFWFIPTLARGDWKWAIIQFLLLPVTFCWSQVVFMFIYNKLYIRDLLNDGYYPLRQEDAKLIVAYRVCSLEEMKVYKSLSPFGDLSGETI